MTLSMIAFFKDRLMLQEDLVGQLLVVLQVRLVLMPVQDVMMVVAHAWLMVKDMAFLLGKRGQAHHFALHSGGRVVCKVVPLVNELGQGAIVMRCLSHWMSRQHLVCFFSFGLETNASAFFIIISNISFLPGLGVLVFLVLVFY